MPNIDVHAHILPQSAVRAYEAGTRLVRDDPDAQRLTARPACRRARASRRSAPCPNTGSRTRDRIRTMDEDEYRHPGDVPQSLSSSGITSTPTLAIACAQSVNDEIAEAVRRQPPPLRSASPPCRCRMRRRPCAGSSVRCSVLKLKGHDRSPRTSTALNWDDPFALPDPGGGGGARTRSPAPTPSTTASASPRLATISLNLIGNPLETTIAAASLILGGVLDRLPNLKVCLSPYRGLASRLPSGASTTPMASGTTSASMPPRSRPPIFAASTTTASRTAMQGWEQGLGPGRGPTAS